MRLIDGSEILAEGGAELARIEPRFAPVLEAVGPLPLRRHPDGFAALADAIIAQQVSVASARAIRARVAEAGLDDPARVAAASEDDLRACGLSRPKVRYFKTLAVADLPYDRLRTAPDDEVIATLVSVPGIGTWTAEIYAMFALGRPDVLAAGDLALQEAARQVFDLDARPTEKALRAMAAAWSPWRAVAARALWAYYRVTKQREGVI